MAIEICRSELCKFVSNFAEMAERSQQTNRSGINNLGDFMKESIENKMKIQHPLAINARQLGN